MKDSDIDPNQLLFLWRLAGAGGEVWLREMRMKPGKAERRKLIERGLVEESSETHPETNRAGIHVCLTEKGWEALRAPEPGSIEANPRAGEVLEQALGALGEGLGRLGLTIEEVILASPGDRSELGAEGEGAKASDDRVGDSVEDREPSVPASLADAAIIRAVEEATSRRKPRIPLGDLRLLVSLSDRDFDAGLQRMISAGTIEVDPPDTRIGHPESESGATVALVKERNRYLRP